MKLRKNRKLIMLLLALAVVVCGVCALAGRSLLGQTPFASKYEFTGPSGVFLGGSGRTFVVDGAKKSVVVISGDGQYEFSIAGGVAEDGFYYASLVTDDPSGTIYIADTVYTGEGTTIGSERILRYDAEGGYLDAVYQVNYAGGEEPLQYGRIKSMYIEGGELVFASAEDGGVTVNTLELSGGTVAGTYYSSGDNKVSYCAVDPLTKRPVFCTRRGGIYGYDEAGGLTAIYPEENGRTVWQLDCDGQSIYFTDMAACQLLSIPVSGGEETEVLSSEDILYSADVLGDRLCTTDQMGYYISGQDGMEYVYELPLSNVALRNVLWVVLAIGALCLLALLVELLLPVIRMKKTETFTRIAIVLVVSICISVVVSYLTLSTTLRNQNAMIMDELNMFGDMLISATDVDGLAEIDDITYYDGELYKQVKQPLDDMTDMSYANGLYYYYILYTHDDDTIYVTMDYEDTATSRHPLYPYGTEGYTDVFEYGEPIEVNSDVSAYGAWAFVLKPVFNDAGEVAAMMEVGVNLDELHQNQSELVLKIILTVASTAVILVMLIIEVLFYMEYSAVKRSLPNDGSDINLRFPLRTLIFFTFMADCMQDAFVSILANQMYEPVFGIPQSVGAALPLSAQVLAAALFALLCGSIVTKLGVKKTLAMGYILQIAGFAVCATMLSYWTLLGGKILIGAGIGMITVCLNTVSALGEREDATAATFAGISAGTLAGVTVGAGVGSLILSFSDYSAVYIIGGAVLVLGLLMVLVGLDCKPGSTKKEKKRIGLGAFLRDRQAVSFLVLALMPFLVSLSFREYFFPIYAAEMGLTESDIGQIYLACGLVVIYAGPLLTKVLVDRLSAKWTVVISSALVCAATLSFVVSPTLPATIVGVALLSIAISFGYAAQSTYYSGVSAVERYGESRAMGVYSLFDNGGQTLGPVIYGLAMMMGYRRGMMTVGLCLTALLALFVLINLGKKNKQTEER